MKTFTQFTEGMRRSMIASFRGREGEIEIEREGLRGFYGQVNDKWDFSVKNVKELRAKLKELGADPNDPSYGEIPKKYCNSCIVKTRISNGQTYLLSLLKSKYRNTKNAWKILYTSQKLMLKL